MVLCEWLVLAETQVTFGRLWVKNLQLRVNIEKIKEKK